MIFLNKFPKTFYLLLAFLLPSACNKDHSKQESNGTTISSTNYDGPRFRLLNQLINQ